MGSEMCIRDSSIGAVDAILIDGKGEVSTGADFRGDDYGEILK